MLFPHTNSRFFVTGLAAALTATGAALAAPGVLQGTAAAPTRQIGDVRVGGSKDIVLTAVQNTKRGTLDFDLKGSRVTITSARYDLSAPHITLSIKNSKAQTGTAVGGVAVEVRNPEQRQTSTLRCAAADYFAARGQNPARLELKGSVTSILRDPQLAVPLETRATDGGTVLFLPDGTNSIKLRGTTISGTPIEPTPKKK
jgi:outer membrane receptor protein involved in Fe transport